MSRQDSQPPTESSEDDDSARSQRIAAMRELAGADASSTVTPLSSLATKSPGQQNRRVPALLIALTVIVVVASVFAAWQGWFPWQRGKPTTVANTTSVNLADYDLQCPSAAVWSPDDKRIAVLAQLGACSNSDAGIIEPNVVALFNIHGKLERLLYPDNLALGKDAPTTPHPTPMAGAPLPTTEPTSAHYWAMGWSPDGVRLALVYETLFKRDQKGFGPFESGLILLPVDGSSGEKLSGLTNPTSDVWDLQARRQIRGNAANQTPSFVYQWSSQAMLTPVANSVASGPIGSPSGGQRFTIWQPGGVLFDRDKHTLVFSFATMAWSPDGRYIVPSFGFGGELAPGTSGISQSGDGSYQLAPRDLGLISAASRLKSPSDPYATNMPVAWRGDGRLLAAREPNLLIDQVIQRLDGTVLLNAMEHIDVYDCATGAKRLTLATKPLANRLQWAAIAPPSALRWSPSGQKLSWLDAPFDSLTIWDVAVK